MSLKQLIKSKQILRKSPGSAVLEIPGDPLIYSVKYSIGNRRHSHQFFKNMQWKSILRSYFLNCMRSQTPVVVLATFYLAPPEKISISSKRLMAEKTPATACFELCEYTLCLLEMLHRNLINTYKQIVKLDVDKFYSHNPRTVLRFMPWIQYEELQNSYTLSPKTKGVSTPKQEGMVQS